MRHLVRAGPRSPAKPLAALAASSDTAAMRLVLGNARRTPLGAAVGLAFAALAFAGLAGCPSPPLPKGPPPLYEEPPPPSWLDAGGAPSPAAPAAPAAPAEGGAAPGAPPAIPAS